MGFGCWRHDFQMVGSVADGDVLRKGWGRDWCEESGARGRGKGGLHWCVEIDERLCIAGGGGEKREEIAQKCVKGEHRGLCKSAGFPSKCANRSSTCPPHALNFLTAHGHHIALFHHLDLILPLAHESTQHLLASIANLLDCLLQLSDLVRQGDVDCDVLSSSSCRSIHFRPQSLEHSVPGAQKMYRSHAVGWQQDGEVGGKMRRCGRRDVKHNAGARRKDGCRERRRCAGSTKARAGITGAGTVVEVCWFRGHGVVHPCKWRADWPSWCYSRGCCPIGGSAVIRGVGVWVALSPKCTQSLLYPSIGRLWRETRRKQALSEIGVCMSYKPGESNSRVLPVSPAEGITSHARPFEPRVGIAWTTLLHTLYSKPMNSTYINIKLCSYASDSELYVCYETARPAEVFRGKKKKNQDFSTLPSSALFHIILVFQSCSLSLPSSQSR